jgi:mRNA interferase MazF
VKPRRTRSYVPERGEAIWLAFDPQAGHEQSGRRPAVVLSPASYNEKTGLALVCPITSRQKGYPFEVSIPAGCAVAGSVLADQIRSLDWRARQASRICVLPAGTMEEVVGKARALLE